MSVVTSHEEAIKWVEEMKDKDEPYLIYITGALREDGTSWCPDCVETAVVCKFIMEESNIPNKLKTTVTRDDWLGKPHPFKVHALIKAGGVPTMAVFSGTSCMLRMDTADGNADQFKDQDTVDQFLEFDA